jgi:SAM-dependent methyltransferase
MFEKQCREIMKDYTITFPINCQEKPKEGLPAFLCRIFPGARKVLDRMPEAMREKVFDPHVTVNERIVEHPWIFMKLGLREGRILDVGCCHSSLSIELASLGYEVWGVDINPYRFSHRNFRFVLGDVCAVSLPEEHYDRIIAVSSVEHFGLEVYGGRCDAEHDRISIRRMHRLLKPGGKILVTVPFGIRNITPEFRVYDSPALQELMSPFRIEEQSVFIRTGEGFWIPSRCGETLLGPRAGNGSVQAVAMVVAAKEAVP